MESNRKKHLKRNPKENTFEKSFNRSLQKNFVYYKEKFEKSVGEESKIK